MSKHTSHRPAHFVTGMAVVAAGAASTLMAVYTVSKATLPHDVRICAMIIVGVLTASLALMPMFLAPAYGDAIRNGKARKHLLALTIVILFVDGLMQMNAINVIAEAMKIDHVNHIAAFAGIAGFQLATFFIRGKLIEAHNERQAEVARQQLAIAEQAVELEKLAAKKERNRKAAERRRKKKAAAAKAEKNNGLTVVEGGRK